MIPQTQGADPRHLNIRSAVSRVVPGVLALALAIGLSVVAPVAANAAPIGTGAVSVKNADSQLLPGATLHIRKGSCAGPGVWRSTTGSTPGAFGAFGIGLEVGTYCIQTEGVPEGYGLPADVTFEVKPGRANWVTVWVPRAVTGAVVAKDPWGIEVEGVTALIREGSCATPGRAVWRNTTAFAAGTGAGFGISLLPGQYCTTVENLPAIYAVPVPVETTVSPSRPAWITIWLPSAEITGSGNGTVVADIDSFTKVVTFSCPDCVGEVGVYANAEGFTSPVLTGNGSYVRGRALVGFLDDEYARFFELEVRAAGNWTLTVDSIESVRTFGSVVGEGDDVRFFEQEGTAMTLSHTGSGFFDAHYLGEFIDTRATTGPSSGTEQWSAPAFVQVNSDGPWSITATPMGTGAVSVKNADSQPLPGATVVIRKGECTGQAVWRSTTGSTPGAFGAFGISLEIGTYCIQTEGVPAGYGLPADVTFEVQASQSNWVTVWVPRSSPER